MENASITRRDFSFSHWLFESRRERLAELRAKTKELSSPELLEKSQLIMDLVKQKVYTHWPMWRPFWSAKLPTPVFGAGDRDADGFGTMATDGKRIYYCPVFVVEMYELGKINFAQHKDFVDGKPPKANAAIKQGLRHPMDYAVFVILHEIMHCSLKHFIRMPDYESPTIDYGTQLQLWNIAADYEINHYLLDDVKSDLYVMVEGGIRADQGYFKVPDEDLEFFSTGFAEDIFMRLIENLEAKYKKQEEPEDDEDGEDESEDKGNEEGDQDGENPGEDDGDQDGGEEEGEGEPDGGEGDQDSDDPQAGDGDPDSDQDIKVKPGSIIYDRATGKYGKVSKVSGDSVEWDEISEDEARKASKK